MADLQLVSYILGTCATVDEVKEAVSSIKIHPIDPRASTIHWRFTEESGRQIVLEIIDQKCIFYENELGVLTNSLRWTGILPISTTTSISIPAKSPKGSSGAST